MTAVAKKVRLQARTIAAVRREIRALAQADDGDCLLCHALSKSRAWLYTRPERRLSDTEKSRIERALESSLAGMPIAYLRGRKEFFSLDLKVTADTLIPRPETELLVERALRCHKPGLRALDLGTGCGNIALALRSQRPDWAITATDVSQAALRIAQDNAQRHRLGDIRFIQSDWFAALSGTFDLIVSNPPYIAKDDPDVAPQVAQYEPATALFAKDDGLACLREIIAAGIGFMKADARLIVEHGHRQASAVRAMIVAAGYKDCEQLSDGAGHPRVAVACA